MAFLPVSRDDMRKREWDALDFLFISGDAYVDHPSFGHAIITRVLESEGYRVGIIAQPDWKVIANFKKLGRPELGVLISSGVIDSMVNHYTTTKKVRKNDQYSPGGKAGLRPDRAVIVYTHKIREAFGQIPIIIGGVEASLRRFAHYDYWDDLVRPSVLIHSGADILVYGMGESPIVEIARLLKKGVPIKNMLNLRGTCVAPRRNDCKGELAAFLEHKEHDDKYVLIESFEEVRQDPRKYASAFMMESNEQDYVRGKTIVQPHADRLLIQNPPPKPLSEKEMDKIYALPYERAPHPMYENIGGVAAIEEVKFGIVSHRGCFGGCSFCALNFHQGRVIQRRSDASIIGEAENFTRDKDFKGYIHDVGGPTANFRNKACDKQEKHGACRNKQCLTPEPCRNLKVSHSDYLMLLSKLRKIPGIKKVFIRSGIRYDYLMLDKDERFFEDLCRHHISGQLKVAPEHICPAVLEKMGKPSSKVYDNFVQRFSRVNKRLGKEQYLVPYLLSSHPGSTLKSSIKLAEYLKAAGINPEQVQDFYPTPGTLSTCMFFTGLDPRSMKKVYIPRSYEERKMQRALLQFRRPENHDIILQALQLADRMDLVGFGPLSLIRPRAGKPAWKTQTGLSDRKRKQTYKKVNKVKFKKSN
ncbi:MAG: YgiQ family radical SAM protein [Nitrospirae bacterium]|nr:YgiQ family radical SAM protein [Nitrospirota bacterium]